MKTVLDWVSDNPGMTVIILIFVVVIINILR
jgi:hypothetical protein